MRKFLCGRLKVWRVMVSCIESEVSNGSNMLTGNEQDMLWRLWIDICKRYQLLVLIDNFTG